MTKVLALSCQATASQLAGAGRGGAGGGTLRGRAHGDRPLLQGDLSHGDCPGLRGSPHQASARLPGSPPRLCPRAISAPRAPERPPPPAPRTRVSPTSLSLLRPVSACAPHPGAPRGRGPGALTHTPGAHAAGQPGRQSPNSRESSPALPAVRRCRGWRAGGARSFA